MEEGTDVAFTVAASAPVEEALSVNVAVSGGEDFTDASPAEVEVTIAAGESVASLTVATIDDLLDEPDGAIAANLLSGEGYAVGEAAAASVTVSDDDAVPGVVASLALTPGDGQVEVSWLSPDEAGTSPITSYTVEYADNADFNSSTTLDTGDAPTETADSDDDSAGEGDEEAGEDAEDTPTIPTSLTITGLTNGQEYHFRVRAVSAAGPGPYSSPGGSTPAPASGLTVTIAAVSSPVEEGTEVAFTVTASAPVEDALTVSVAVSGGEAFTDASPAKVEVTIAVGESSGAITLATDDDLLDEPDGAIAAAVQPGVGYAVGEAATASVTVSDDDVVPGVVAALAVTAGDGKAEVSWLPPNEAGTSPIIAYIVEYADNAQFNSSSTVDTRDAPVETEDGEEAGETAGEEDSEEGEDTETEDEPPAVPTSLTIIDLTNGQEYHFRVRAVSAAGQGPYSAANAVTLPPGTAAQQQAPGAPTNFTATLTALDTVTLSWTAPTNKGGASVIDRYLYDRRVQGSPTWTSDRFTPRGSNGADAPTTYVDDLSRTRGTTYEYRVQTVVVINGASIFSGWSNTDTVTLYDTPGEPTGLTTTPAAGPSIELAWDAPSDTGHGITRYDVRYKELPSGSWVTVNNATTGARTYTITGSGLTAGKKYEVQVRSGNVFQSGWSASARTPRNLFTTFTNAPVNLVGRVTAPGEITLNWDPPPDLEGVSWVDWYRVDFGVPVGQNNIRWVNIMGTYPNNAPTTLRQSSLTPGTTYQIRVQRVLTRTEPVPSISYRDWSNTVSVKALGAPSAPRNYRATASASPGKIVLNWSAPSSNGHKDITGYDVRWRETGTSAWTLEEDATDEDGRTYTITGLTAGTEYDTAVRAAHVLDGHWASATVRAHSTVTVAAADSDATVDEGDDVAFVVTVNPALSTNLTVTLGVTVNEDAYDHLAGDHTVTVTAGATTATLTLTGQQNLLDTVDGVVTAAIKGTGYAIGTPGSAAVTITDDDRAPGAPTNSHTNNNQARRVILTWDAPADPGTSTIDRYHIQWSESRTFAGTPGSATSTTTSHTITGLTADTQYYLRVRAESAAGLGPWLTATVTTGYAPPLAPTVSVSTDILPASTTPAGRITATWTAPTDDGGTPITSYDVRYRSAGTTAWTDITRTNTDTSLTEEISYSGPAASVQVEVRAVNVLGDGEWGRAVANFCRGNIALKDCRILLLSRDTLVGSGGGVNWAAGTPVGRWTGVTVNSAGRVTRIHLEGLDTNSIRLKGTIPPILGQLDALERLWLGDGVVGTQDDPDDPFLTGSIPAELGNLSNLRRLAIAGNRFTGTSIPEELGNLRSLTSLLLNQNELTGSIPEELGNLSNLTSLYMGNNRLTGSIPEELGNLSNLIVLHVSANRLTGGIPEELGSLTSLLHLVLAQNPNLGGTIPEELGNLSRLTRLRLEETGVTGSIPSQLGNLTNLQDFIIRDNDLSGDIPGELGALTRLNILFMRGNSLTGCLPTPWSKIRFGSTDINGLGLLWCTPLRLAATAGDRQVSLTWSAPTTSSAGKALFHEYKLQYSTSSNFSSGAQTLDYNKDTTSATVTGLTTGLRYYFRIGYTTSSTQTTPAIWSPKVSAIPTGTLAAPQLTLTRGDQQISMSWVAPPHNAGSVPTAYDVRHRPRTGETTWGAWTEVDDAWVTGGGGLTYVIRNLTNGTEYDVRVRGVNTFGDGAWSGEATATPATLPGAPANVSATPTSNGEVTIQWDAPADDGGAAVSRYTVQYADNSAFTNSTTGDSTATSLKTGQLTLGTEHHFRVRAVNAVGNSAWSATVTATPRKPPGAPTIDTVTPGDEQLTVTWSAPATDNGAPITRYEVWLRVVGSNTTNGSILNVGQNFQAEHTFTSPLADGSDLVNGTRYEVRVRASNAAGPGPSSALVYGTPARPPDAPSITGVVIRDRALLVKWNPPASNGGAAIDDYDVRHRPRGNANATWTEVDPATDQDGRQYLITGLTNGTTYELQVRAVNARGDGAWSASATGEPAFGVTVDPTTLTVNENHYSSYTVVLRSRPSSDVKIIVSSDESRVTVDTNTNTSGDQNTLTFTSTNWDTPQRVMVSADEDNVLDDYTATISHSVDDDASDDEYDGLDIDDVAVTVGDNDVLLPPANLRAVAGRRPGHGFLGPARLPAHQVPPETRHRLRPRTLRQE